MAKIGVQVLEGVDVQKMQGNLAARLAGDGESMVQPVRHQQPVGEVGYIVMAGQIVDTLLSGMPFADVAYDSNHPGLCMVGDRPEKNLRRDFPAPCADKNSITDIPGGAQAHAKFEVLEAYGERHALERIKVATAQAEKAVIGIDNTAVVIQQHDALKRSIGKAPQPPRFLGAAFGEVAVNGGTDKAERQKYQGGKCCKHRQHGIRYQPPGQGHGRVGLHRQ